MISRDEYNSKANVVSLVAKDVEKIAEACLSLQYLWSGIFETVAVLCVVITLLGPITILPGVGLMCFFLPLQYVLGLFVAFRKKNLAVVSAKRISLMEEIMRGIKLIKIYGWEASFAKNLQEIRGVEALMLARINRVKAAILGLIVCLPPIMCIVIFGSQEPTGSIDATVIFTALPFVTTLHDVLDAMSAMVRVQEILLEPDLPLARKVQGWIMRLTSSMCRCQTAQTTRLFSLM